eukprot:TRINITY_DN325_c0_g1_i1.p1 TRINITY_DN325_c0_g1~~TRINITY_DN325_c0_g1_i1.p1  ORF type:complete len:689 (+),score=176.30 TRINITY_DN325_c0_g1_i1:25-2067(+)
MVRAPELVVVMGVAVLVLCCGVVCFDGDQDLSRAYAAAWLDARPSVLATLRSINASHIASADCVIGSLLPGVGTDYPALPISSDNSLRLVLSNKEIKVGILVTNSLYDVIKSGVMDAVINKLGQHYGVPITIKYIERTDEYQLIYELLSRKIDVLAPTYNHFIAVNKHARLEHLTQTCTGMSFEFNFLSTYNASSLNDLISFTRTNKKTILVQTPEQQFLAEKLLGVSTEVRGFGLTASMLVGNGSVSAMIASIDFEPHNSIFLVNTSFIVPIRGYTRTEQNYVTIPNSQIEASYDNGNNYLRTIFDSAIAATQNKNYAILNNKGSEFKIASDCAPAIPVVPRSLAGISQTVYDQSVIKIGYYPVYAAPLYDFSKINIATDLQDNIVSQRENDILKNVVGIFNQKQIGIQKVKYNSFDEMMSELDKGTIQATTAMTFLGSSYKGAPLRDNYELSCSALAWELSFYFKFGRLSDHELSLDEFKSAVAQSSNPKILVDNDFIKSAVATLFDPSFASSIVVISNPTIGWELLTQAPVDLSNNTIAYVPTYIDETKINEGILASISRVRSDLIVNTGMVFRKNHRHAMASYEGPDTRYPRDLADALSGTADTFQWIPDNSKLSWGYWFLIALAIVLGLLILAIIIALIVKCCNKKKYHKLKADDDIQLQNATKKDEYTPPSISF